MKKIGIVLSTIFVMLLMVSTVSAVPYNEGSQTISNMGNINDNLEEFRDSEAFLQLEQMINENFPEGNEQYIDNNIQQFLAENELPTDEGLIFYDILIIIAEFVMLILGHNIVGQSTAMLVTLLAAVPDALVYAFGLAAAYVAVAGVFVLLAYVFFGDLIQQMIEDLFQGILYDMGILFGTIFLLLVAIVGLILVILGTPVAYAVLAVYAYFDLIIVMFNYIFGGGSGTQLQTNLQELNLNENSVIAELLNNLNTQGGMTLNQQTSEMILGATKGSSTSN